MSSVPREIPLQIAFLDSWKTAPCEGTGTAAAIVVLASGLRELGHQVDLLRPPSGKPGESPDEVLARRLHFNLEVEGRLTSLGQVDLVVGFDFDGVFLEPRPHRPFVASLKGVAADEVRFAAPNETLILETVARFEAMTARRAHRVIVPSRYSAERAVRSYRLSPDRVAVVPEALDPAPWEAERTRVLGRDRRPTVLSVARQYRRKDTATLVRAMVAVRRAVPSVRLRVVGGGPELPALRQLASDLGLASAVEFTGPISQAAQVRQAYRESLVFALPSVQEAFGIVFLEAMAAGLPIVAARAGATPEVVDDGRTGILVPTEDPASLAEAILKLLRDPVLRDRMGAAGRETVTRFTPRQIAEHFLRAVFLPPPDRTP